MNGSWNYVGDTDPGSDGVYLCELQLRSGAHILAPLVFHHIDSTWTYMTGEDVTKDVTVWRNLED